MQTKLISVFWKYIYHEPKKRLMLSWCKEISLDHWKFENVYHLKKISVISNLDYISVYPFQFQINWLSYFLRKQIKHHTYGQFKNWWSKCWYASLDNLFTFCTLSRPRIQKILKTLAISITHCKTLFCMWKIASIISKITLRSCNKNMFDEFDGLK